MKKKLLLMCFVCATYFANAQQTIIWSENFNTENLSGWTLIDANGDGYKWGTSQNLGNDWQPIGTPFLYSLSYTQYLDLGNLYPDDWAITPAINLSAVNQGETINFSWYLNDTVSTPLTPFPNNENYAVYIAESNDTTAFIASGIKFTESNIPITYTLRSIDLSEFAGKTIYIAFRHYNCADSIVVSGPNSEVDIDDMKITIGNPSSVIDHALNSEISISPNPANKSFKLSLPSNFVAEKTKVEIIDITGKIMSCFIANTTTYDISDLATGFYLVCVSDGEKTAYTKLIKNN